MSKPISGWTNWMSMEETLESAKDRWPKSEHEDLCEYFLASAYKSIVAQLASERDAFGKREIELMKERDDAVRAMNAAHDSLRKSGEQDSELRRERDEARTDLDKAIQYLREGKAKFAPNTTNSFVDELLEKYPQDSPTESK